MMPLGLIRIGPRLVVNASKIGSFAERLLDGRYRLVTISPGGGFKEEIIDAARYEELALEAKGRGARRRDGGTYRRSAEAEPPVQVAIIYPLGGTAMPDLTPWFLLLFVAVAIQLMAISVPLMRGRIGPNSWYGVRTKKTLGDEGVWYQSNAYGGRILFRAGLVQLVAVIALFFVPSLRSNFIAYNLVCATVIVGGAILAFTLIMRHLRSL
jgi:hypothetical protein